MGRGFGVSAAVDAGVLAEVSGEAERLGYTSFWVNDMPHAGGLPALAAVAGATRHLRIGVGVLPLDQRPPDAIAGQVRSLGLPLDRLVLGVGSGDAPQALDLVRGGAAALERELGVAVVVGALGPRMAALAGEVASGALLNWLTPAYADRAAGAVREAADRAGRPRPAVMAYVRAGLLPGAEDRLRRELAVYAGIAHFHRHLERMGSGAEDTCVLAAEPGALRAGIERYEPALDEVIVRALTPDDRSESLLELLRACAP